MEEALHNAYYGLDSPASFTGISQLHRQARKSYPSLTLEQVKSWLSGQDTYTLYRQVNRKSKQHSATVVGGIQQQYQADLVEMGNLSRFNGGVRYLLTCIDVFSKRAWVVPLKTKKCEDVAVAFATVLKNGIPKRLQTDRGKEFSGAPFQKLLKKHGIAWFFSLNEEVKCAVVERFNRTLQGRLARYFDHYDTNSYLKALPKIVSAYNNSYHRSIKCRPTDVNDQNESDIWVTLYGHLQPPGDNKHRYVVGDSVRLAHRKGTFGRGYVEQWTKEVFEICERKLKSGHIPVYIVRDSDGNVIHGFWYERELQRVTVKNL
jgi:transposase InsO family protein